MTAAHTLDFIKLEEKTGAQNYAPLPVVLTRGEKCRVWDVEGREYLDFMSAYSAVSLGHAHPRILKTLQQQAQELSLTSRAFYTNRLGPYLAKICAITGMDAALPMNTGAEAVETAIKAARRWGYRVKGIAKDKAKIIVAEGNFHGRTTTIVGFSSDNDYKADFGPFDGGFKAIPFGDAKALEKAITKETCAFLVEPMQGEGGIILPPKGWLKEVAAICRRHNVLLILDEIQTGLARTGKMFAFQHELDGPPDGLILGKALGGGVLPASVFVARHDVMQVFNPGSHGSTFGGNPLAAAVGLEALRILEEEKLALRSRRLGDYLQKELRTIRSPLIKEIRGSGLWVGVEIDPKKARARDICLKLLEKGILCKETHETVVRFAPPLVIEKEEIDRAVTALREVLSTY